MSFVRASGKTKLMYFKKTASTVLKDGGLVKISVTGRVQACTNDTTDYIIGVGRRTTASTDSDYTSCGFYPVEVPVENYVEWEFTTDSDNGLADSDVGRKADIDTTTDSVYATGVDVSASTVDHVLITKYISASKGRCVIARLAPYTFAH